MNTAGATQEIALMHDCVHAPGRQRTSTLEEFFGEDTGFFELQSQIQLAQRRYAQGGGLGEGGLGGQASGQEGSASPDMQASQQGKCCPSDSQYPNISQHVFGSKRGSCGTTSRFRKRETHSMLLYGGTA